MVTSIIDYASVWHAEQEVVSRTPEGPIVITTYADIHRRSQYCALALQRLGVRKGSIVATLAWNTHRHMEAWYGIMGLGAVCHTLNPRLSVKDLAYIVNDAKDCVIMADITFVQLLEAFLPACPSVKAVVLMTDRQHMPRNTALNNPLCYESLLDDQVDKLPFRWETVDENDACGLCYTSGTTGNPKGVLYSHRSNFLQSMVVVQADSVPISSNTTLLAVVPMFHANCWSLVFSGPMTGARLVFPGPALDGPSVYQMIENYRVTISMGVPTVWLGLLQHLSQHSLRFSTLKLLVIGGSAAPRIMIEEFQKKYGVEVRHAWGMTELSPVGTMGGLKGTLGELSPDEIIDVKTGQGRPHIFCDMRLVDDGKKVLPHDGQAVGHLQVRGSIVVKQYFNITSPSTTDAEGWFDTGDVASIDTKGHMRISDRSKDVIKSGGEWISSIDLENAAMAHPAVTEAAAVAIPSDKWGERPLLVVTLKDGSGGSEQLRLQLLEHMVRQGIARYAVPDDVVFVKEIPHNATGKISKITLREMFKSHKAPRSQL